MRQCVLTLVLSVLVPHVALCKEALPPERLLLHWSFEEGKGATTQDLSGNGLHGTVQADWARSPSGHAVVTDGTSRKIVSVSLPEKKRFGRDSWTFMAMVKPTRFQIDKKQNQRRLFAFGAYPDANLIIDLTGQGRLSSYFCYKDASGKVISTGGGESAPLVEGQWAHVALVCDRKRNTITLYVNGYSPQSAPMVRGFDGNFVLGGRLTVGSSWQNYWGQVDEVKVYRSALSKAQVAGEFDGLKRVFSIKESATVLAAKKREGLLGIFGEINAAWTVGDFKGARILCEKVVGAPEAPAHFRSYAHLRIAQSYLRQKSLPQAQATCEKIAANTAYPAVHRHEAREYIKEIARMDKGLPARNPQASRTAIAAITRFAAEVYVSPDGSDKNDGSRNRPFASLARARDAVRALKGHGARGPIAVRIMPGEYRVTGTLSLTTADSGTKDAPIVYRAETKGASTFYGGSRLTGFTPVTDKGILARLPAEARDKVRQCNLRALGIKDYDELKVRGFSQPPSPPTLELFVDGKPMTLARWPNKGFVGIKKLIQAGDKAKNIPSVFQYDSQRHARWGQAQDLWLFGYFHFLWADATIKVGRIDPVAKTVTTAKAYDYGGRAMSTRQGIQYYAFNLLEEIDQPGEWYLDRTAGILYLYPPSDLSKSSVEIGMLSTPMISMDTVSHLRIEGLVFDLARYNGIVATDCDNCLISACTVKRMAGNGISVLGGRKNSLIGCDVHTIGRRGVEVIGGDREALTPGEHLVENCRIHFFGRIDRTYTPAIQLEGVGHRITHNLMYNCPSSVMRIEGNDHVVEYNEAHSAVRESDDQGAMELFRNATYRGVIFRHNYYHQVGKTGAGAAVHGQAGIRFDDAISGMLVYGNIFWQSANGNFGGVQMNSGRDNIMDNNIFVDCKQGISGGWNPGNHVWKMLRGGTEPANFYTTDLYRSRYPELKTMLAGPGVNHVWRNVFYRCGAVSVRGRHIDLFQNGVFTDSDPGFVNAAKGDFNLKQDAPLFQNVGFRPIPVDEIGLYESPHRVSWPVNTTPVALPDWRKPHQ